MDRLYSIGDVHEMTGISVSALRYYADMKIVCSAKIDRQTGYRYYDFAKYSKKLNIEKEVAEIMQVIL